MPTKKILPTQPTTASKSFRFISMCKNTEWAIHFTNESMFPRFSNLLFIFFSKKEEDVKALVLLSKILFKKLGPRDASASLVFLKLNLGSLKLCILVSVK